MHEIAFSIGAFKIHWYGICAACGFLAALAVLLWKRKAAGITRDNILDIGMIAMFAGIIGARIFYVVEFHRQFAENPIDVIRIDKGGLVFYGGFLLACAVLLVYCRIKHIHLLKLLDVFSPALALGHAFGRLGCFLQGCCFGKPAGNCPAGVVFPGGSAPALRYPAPSEGDVLLRNPPSVPVWPTQLIEAGVNVVLFAVLAMMVGKFRKPGRVAGIYFSAYALLRFLMEYLRGDHVDFAFGLFTPSQTVSLFVILPFGIALFLTAGMWGRNGAPE